MANKNDSSKKPAKDAMEQEQGMRRNKFGDIIKDVDAQRHPEEQNIDPTVYGQKDKPDLNGPPRNQKV